MTYQILITTKSWVSARPMGSDVSVGIGVHSVLAAFESMEAADRAAEKINNQTHEDQRIRQWALRLY